MQPAATLARHSPGHHQNSRSLLPFLDNRPARPLLNRAATDASDCTTSPSGAVVALASEKKQSNSGASLREEAEQ